ncbi:hypothetical protein NQ318_015567 [Aromia moschata]|uniref:C3H1-type domain-containing protein n=1 Tax=Aromia moschata TaxID=1265417 RepID=A0AAV8XEH9_9CUCU|nr:hypothetical protein NQ318_015567 [Aromia moschata]
MASRQVFFKDLKVADLKRELEERECETTGKKADLQNRLEKLWKMKKNLEEKLLENATKMQQELQENSSNLRGMEQNLRGMEQKLIENMDQKLLENYTTLEKKITENSSGLQKQMDGKFGEIENKLVTVEEEFQNKFLEVERKIATLNLESGEQRVVNTALKSPGSDIDRLSKPELSSHVEISKIRMKPPQFDGKSSWVNYLRQFEAAAKANGWSLADKATALTLALRGDATDILQTLSLEEQEDYYQLVRHLEMRYGQSHLEHVYHSQLKNRYQKSNESLQEFEADIARLVRLAYSSTPENVMERLAVQAFLDGLRDTETRQALTLARPSKLVDALARALEFEAAKQSCRGQAKVRKMEEGVEEGTCNEAEIRRVAKEILDKRPIRRWNSAKKAFGQLEELRRQRPEVGRVLQITAAEQEKERSVFYLVTKQLSHHKPTYQTVWDTLVELRDVLLSQSISSLAIPKIASGLDGLDWRVIRSMLEVLFRFTGIEILVCCYNPRRSLNEKTVDCFFYQTSRCKNGPFCRYRHRPGDDTIRDEMSLRRGQCYGVRRVVPLAVDFAGRVPDISVAQVLEFSPSVGPIIVFYHIQQVTSVSKE